MSSKDKSVYGYSMSNESADVAERPYIKKELLFIHDDNNGIDYSMNQVNFSTQTFSNNGRWEDYRSGFIVFPIKVTLGTDDNFSAHDTEVLLKASNLCIINSMVITYNNRTIIEQTENIAPYLTFKQQTEYSINDAKINNHVFRYDDSASWTYDDVYGMRNNDKATNSSIKDNKLPYLNAGGHYKVLSDDNIEKSSTDRYDTPDTQNKNYFFDCIVNLKDLPFFQKMPMTRGVNFLISFRLNQCSFKFQHAAATNGAIPTLETVTTTDSNFKGSMCPIIITDPIINDSEFTIDCSVNKKCRLYVPVYTMNPVYQERYLALGQKTVVYEDVYYKKITVNNNDSTQVMVTNALSQMQRMVIIPILNKASNADLNIDANYSPFASEGCTTTPNYISNFNVKLSGSFIYPQNINYKYEHYLDEMNGNYGLNENTETGSSSSLISLKDFQNNYGYIVVNLNRRYENVDDETPMSVELSFKNESPVIMNYHIYLTYQKKIVIDLSTGAEVIV